VDRLDALTITNVRLHHFRIIKQSIALRKNTIYLELKLSESAFFNESWSQSLV